MDRNFLYRSYGYTLERIIDMHGINGSRSVAKALLHKAFKRARGIKTLTRLTTEELHDYIQEINNFFPIEENGHSNEEFDHERR